MACARTVVIGCAALLAGCSLVVDSKIDDYEGRTDAGSAMDAGPTDGGSRDTGDRTDARREDAFVREDAGADADSGPEMDAGGATDAGTDAGPMCSGACVPEVPSGWSGPVALYTGAPGGAAPACAAPYPTNAGEYFGDLDVGSLSCSCACDPATGISCTGNVGLCYGSGVTFCVTACFSPITGPAAGAACTSVSPSGTHAQIIPPAPAAHGSCAPRDAHTRVAPAWGTEAKACGGATTSPAGCGAGETCAPTAGAAFADVCILTSGDVACPASGYTEKQLFYESFTDSRTCSACSCGAATSTCGGHVDFVNTACSILHGRVTGCGEHGSGSRASYTPAPSGTCPPSSSAMAGTVTRNGAITYCCLP
jgi:hypothetical protein